VNFTAYAQVDLQTIKYRNLVIDLGNGLKTNAQLTIPAVGEGPFPSVLPQRSHLELFLNIHPLEYPFLNLVSQWDYFFPPVMVLLVKPQSV
jgi:hypothetical protein